MDEMGQTPRGDGQEAVPLGSVDLDGIIEALDTTGGRLPEEAIRAAREHRDLIVPRLIRTLEDTTADARAGREPEGDAFFFAVFLLTEFRAKEALPAIVEIFSLPDPWPHELFDDAVHETWPRTLATLAEERLDVIDGVIRDPAVDEFVRWNAADSLRYLFRDGLLRREEVVERLRLHLREAMDRQDEVIVAPLIIILNTLAPREAYDDIAEAYRRGLVESGMAVLEETDASIADGDARVRNELDRLPPSGIDDTIAELQTWHSFSGDPDDDEEYDEEYDEEGEYDDDEDDEEYGLDVADDLPLRPLKGIKPPLIEPLDDADEPEDWLAPTTPIYRESYRVGRNDPCPCGSGKKYKKCCGGRPPAKKT